MTAPERTVEDAVAAAVPEWLGSTARLVSLRSPARHSWSHQFRGVVEIAGGSIAIAVKVPRWEEAEDLAAGLAAGPQEDTRREYDELCAVRDAVTAAGDARLASVEPLGYLPEVNAIVTEVLDARPLRWMVRRGTADAGLFEAAGRWLRLYHDRVGDPRDSPMPVDRLAARMDSPVIASGPEDLRRAAGRARSALEAMRGTEVRTANLHGDCNLGNLLVTGDGRVAGIDSNRAVGPVAIDIARFLTDLRTHRGRALTLGMRPSRRRVRDWEEAFLSGYGPVGDGSLPVLRLTALVERWSDLEERLGAARPGSPGWIALRLVRRMIARELLSA